MHAGRLNRLIAVVLNVAPNQCDTTDWRKVLAISLAT